MTLKTRLAKLERDHGGKPGEPLIPPMEVLLEQIIREEREAEARAALVPPFDGNVAAVTNSE